MEDFQEVIVFATIAATLLSIAIAIVLGYKCMRKRAMGTQIKEQMRVRRSEYCSAIGMNLY